VVRSVFTNGPAQNAGLTSGDVVTKANGSPIQNAASFKAMIGKMQSGTPLKLTKLVEGKEKEVQCNLMTMAEIIKASTVPEAGPYDRAVVLGEQQLANLGQQIKKMEEKRIADLKAKAQDARAKAMEMKKMQEEKRKMQMEALRKQAEAPATVPSQVLPN